MVIWGTLGLVVLMSKLGAVEIAFFRCFIGAIILFPYCLYQGHFHDKSLTLKNIFLVFLGGIFVVFNWILLFESFKLSSITVGNVSYYFQPVFLIALGRFFFKEEVSFVKFIFIVLTFCGILMTVDLPFHQLHFGNSQVLGVICALSAGLLYSFATIISKLAKGVRATTIAFFQLFIGALILVPFAKLTTIHYTLPVIGYISLLGAVHTVAAFILYYHSIRQLSTTTIAVLSYIDPIVAILTDIIFFDKTLSLLQVLGILLTLISGYFVVM
jgi:drug/metabolite transporter (DMT)-like permease